MPKATLIRTLLTTLALISLGIAANTLLFTSAPSHDASAVPPGKSAPYLKPRLIDGHVILGFADGPQTQLLANTRESISILSPLTFFIVSPDGQLSGSLAPAVIAAAHAHDIAVWPMVEAGFDPSRTTAILTHATAEHRLLQSIVQAVIKEHLDGINLDFEDMVPSDAPLYTHFVETVQAALAPLGKGVSVDVTPPSSDPNWGIVYQRAALAKIVSYEIVMAYDEHYGGDPVAGSVAALPWTRASVMAALAAGIPRAKLLMGVPFYTRVWFRKDGVLQSTYIPLGQGIADQKIAHAKTVWHPLSEQDVVTFRQAGVSNTIWLENATSLRERGAITQQLGIAGDAIWELDLGDQADLTELVHGF